AKRGGGRSGPSGGRSGERGARSAGGGRSTSGSKTGGESLGPRAPRKPRVEGEAVANSTAAATATIAVPKSLDGEKPARKRRRRRGGVPLENGAGTTASTSQVAAVKPAAKLVKPVDGSAANRTASSSSLLTRIGKGLKSLVTRAPRNQH
ncbi:MAG: ATP-dependent RNA helicase RhlB, partial [Thermomonas sp.]